MEIHGETIGSDSVRIRITEIRTRRQNTQHQNIYQFQHCCICFTVFMGILLCTTALLVGGVYLLSGKISIQISYDDSPIDSITSATSSVVSTTTTTTTTLRTASTTWIQSTVKTTTHIDLNEIENKLSENRTIVPSSTFCCP